MRVCLPTTDDTGPEAELSEHFGRAPVYTVVDTEADTVETVPNESDHHGGTELPPTFVANLDVDAVIVTDIGRSAARGLAERGIEIYEASTGTVSAVVDRFASDDLSELAVEDAHDHGHHDDGDH